MSDRISTQKRSLLMGRVRRSGTEPELMLRHALWSKGLRYRLKTKVRLPGSPDIVFPGKKIAVFVDGCFWHGCPVHGTSPKTNSDFWTAKIKRNQLRDAEANKKLGTLGWSVVRFWEHEIKNDVEQAVKYLEALIKS